MRTGRTIIDRRSLALALALVAPVPLQAGSLEFRSEGFFASPDTRVKFHRESWRYAPHLDVDGTLAVNVVGPILNPGYVGLAGAATTTAIDRARRQVVESGVMGNQATPSRRTVTEYQGGVLVRLEYGPPRPEGVEAISRLILPIEVFKNRRVRWAGGETVLPAAKPEDGHFFFLNDPQGKANQFRFDLGHGRELGVQFLSPTGGLVLSDCRQWNEMNYHLQTRFQGQTMVLFLCLLEPDEPFPAVDLPPDRTPAPAVRMSDQEAVFPARDGSYEIVVANSGQVLVRRQGGSLFSIDAPYVREREKIHALAEPVSFQAQSNRLEVVSQAKDQPLRVRQSFAMEEDGWLSASVQFEGVTAPAQAARVEMALPASLFAGKTVRAAERYVDLPKDQAPEPTLFDDWAGKVPDYDLPPQGPQRVTVICDQTTHTFLSDYRQWGQPSFKLGLLPKDGLVKYRLRFWNEAGPAPAYAKGNLLRDGASFEVGPEGIRPFSCHSWTEKMVEPGTAPVFDTGTAVDGATSLRLTASDPVQKGNAHGFAFVGCVFNRVALKPARRYTVSAYLKADRPGLKAVIYCGESTWAGQDWGPVPVTTEWQRYEFPFYTADFKKSGYYLTWVGLDPQCKEGTLWIDAVQLEEGDLSAFQPANEVEYGVEVVNREKLFEDGASCGAVLRVRNNGTKPLTGTVAYVIRDYWEQPVRTGAVAVRVPAETTSSYPVDLGRFPCGYYRGYFTVPGGEVKELIFGVYQPQPLTPLPDDWPLACHNDPAPLVRKLGFGAVRAFEIFEFASIAPEQGRFDFSRADRLVQRAEQSGLTVLPILGQFTWPAYRREPPIPAYAQEKVTQSAVAGRPLRLVWPTPAAWKTYVRALTSRYKGRITYWEVMNEPNLSMTPQEYVPYLQGAYEAAKEGNPECRVVGVCATSDLAGKPGSFTDRVLALGGARAFDLLSVHLYNSSPPERTLEVGSDQLLERWRATMKEAYGKEASVWHTERSFISRQTAYSARKINVPVEYCDEPQFLIDTFKHKAEYLIRETLLDAVAGNGGRFFWFGLFYAEPTFISVRYFQPYGLDHTEYDQSPCPELIAANGLARALAGMSHPYRQLAWDDANRGCVFTGEQGSLVALWNWKTRSRLAIGVGKTPFVLRGFFGEPIAVAPNDQGELVVDLEGAPKYLAFPGGDPETCRRLLERARLQ